MLEHCFRQHNDSFLLHGYCSERLGENEVVDAGGNSAAAFSFEKGRVVD